MQCQQQFYASEGAAMAERKTPKTQDTRADYTLQSLYSRMAKWSREAVGFDEYRWQKAKAELKDSILGSTIKIDRLRVEATGLKVGAAGTTYSDVYALSDLGAAQLKGKCRSSEGYGSSGTKSVGTPQFDNHVRISIHEESDRLSLELAGTSLVNITGRVTKAAVCTPGKGEWGFWRGLTYSTGTQLSIEITTWSRVK